MASVELRGLTKKYGPQAVVDDISMVIEHGITTHQISVSLPLR